MQGRKRTGEWLAKVLAAPFDEVSFTAPPISKETIPVVKDAADGMETEMVSNVAPDKRIGGRGHTIDSYDSRNKVDVEGGVKWARKKKFVLHDEHVVVDAPTDIDVNVVAAEAMFKSKLIPDGRGDIGRHLLMCQLLHGSARHKRLMLSVSLVSGF